MVNQFKQSEEQKLPYKLVAADDYQKMFEQMEPFKTQDRALQDGRIIKFINGEPQLKEI